MSESPCRQVSSWLSVMLDGDLPEGEAEGVRRHLAECEGCQAEWASLDEAVTALRELSAPEPRPDALTRLHARLTASRRPVPVRVLALGATAAAVIFAAALLRLLPDTPSRDEPFVGRVSRPDTPTPRPAVRATPQQGTVLASRPLRGPDAGQSRTASHRRHRRRPQRVAAAVTPPSAVATPEEPRGSMVLVVVTGPRAEAPPPEPEPLALADAMPLVPGTSIMVAQVPSADGGPGSLLTVTRTVGEDLRVESVHIAYEPLPGVVGRVEAVEPYPKEEVTPDDTPLPPGALLDDQPDVGAGAVSADGRPV